MIKKIARWLIRTIVPRRLQKKIDPIRTIYGILNSDYGYFETFTNQRCLDAGGNPIPWYTYPAIEYLQQLDFTEKCVFEYGSGDSTLFWGREAKRVYSVEDNRVWYEKINASMPANCEIALKEDPGEYYCAISAIPFQFDVIVIDGFIKGKSRLECARASAHKLADGGLIILDNSDWLPECSEYLRNLGLLEVDFHGFGPMGRWTWTTSLYFHRKFCVPSKNGVQPVSGKGSLHYLPEKEAS